MPFIVRSIFYIVSSLVFIFSFFNYENSSQKFISVWIINAFNRYICSLCCTWYKIYSCFTLFCSCMCVWGVFVYIIFVWFCIPFFNHFLNVPIFVWYLYDLFLSLKSILSILIIREWMQPLFVGMEDHMNHWIFLWLLSVQFKSRFKFLVYIHWIKVMSLWLIFITNFILVWILFVAFFVFLAFVLFFFIITETDKAGN